MLLETPGGLLDDEHADDGNRPRGRGGDRLPHPRPAPHLRAVHEPGLGDGARRVLRGGVRPLDATGAGGGLAHEGESIEVVELGLQEAIDLVETGGIVDGKTVILLQWASRHLVG